MWLALSPLMRCGFPSSANPSASRSSSAPRSGRDGADEFGADAAALLGDAQASRRWGMADGCALDGQGNLWVTLILANKIVAITPEGHVTVVIEDPEGKVVNAPTSVAWGGANMRDVYIGSIATPYVLKGRSSVPGMPMVHQR